MEYRKYMHIERLGREEVDGILNGLCFIFPKIDGTKQVEKRSVYTHALFLC